VRERGGRARTSNLKVLIPEEKQSTKGVKKGREGRSRVGVSFLGILAVNRGHVEELGQRDGRPERDYFGRVRQFGALSIYTI